MLQALSGIEEALSDIHRTSIAIRACKPPAAPVTSPSTAKGRRGSTPGKTGQKINAREAAQTAAIDLQIQDATKAAASVARRMRNDKHTTATDSFTYLANMPLDDPAEHADNADSEDLDNLQDAVQHHRQEGKSSKSNLLGEALNVDTAGAQADSYDSAINDDSQTSGDKAFVSNSPRKQSEKRHPRHLAARNNIDEAAGQDPLLRTAKLQGPIPTAYCRRGHLLQRQPIIMEGTLAACRFCDSLKPASDLITCTCWKTSEGAFYACNKCLQAGKSYPAPPDCPCLQCPGHCLIKYIPLAKACSQCLRYLPPNTRAWFCTEDSCKPVHILCVQCHNSTLPPTVTPTPIPNTPAYSSFSKGPPAPMPGTKGGSRA
jgi:hypothetical protein